MGGAYVHLFYRFIISEHTKKFTCEPSESGAFFRRCYTHQFYLTYPQIVEALPPKFKTDGKTLVSKLSFTHIVELIPIDDDTKRAFYEIECIKGTWSARELKRQINSLYYERSGLSKDKEKLAELVRAGTEVVEPKLSIRDPYIFEFLGLKPQEVMSETHLEDQLLDKLQEFLLELGHGFCFDARQKRILIGDTNNFVDLVFYHRIQLCHGAGILEHWQNYCRGRAKGQDKG